MLQPSLTVKAPARRAAFRGELLQVFQECISFFSTSSVRLKPTDTPPLLRLAEHCGWEWVGGEAGRGHSEGEREKDKEREEEEDRPGCVSPGGTGWLMKAKMLLSQCFSQICLLRICCDSWQTGFVLTKSLISWGRCFSPLFMQ